MRRVPDPGGPGPLCPSGAQTRFPREVMPSTVHCPR